ncbi:MAG: general secretion pathway protein GspK [Verrucomicrobiaceae bacterium]|nr:general secretion pathway protein GspK [Verrucomicrobiaceae bacterium]
MHLRPTINRPRHQGSALIAVFWLIAVLGMVVFGATKMLATDSHYAKEARGRIYAKRLAEMGLAVGQHPAITPDDPLLNYSSEMGGSYSVNIVAEEARFNINALLLNGDRSLLRRIFQKWNMKPEFASALSDALKDWVDQDDLVSLNGAEKREYEKEGLEGMPFNRPFKDLDEMLFVRGMEQVNAFYPGWRDWFTVFGDGRIDVNDAKPELIAVLADVPMERVGPLMQYRLGMDGVKWTKDDSRLTSAIQVAQMLGVFQPQIVQQLTQWTQFAGPIRRIESVGSLGDVSRKLVIISQNNQVLWRGELPNHG